MPDTSGKKEPRHSPEKPTRRSAILSPAASTTANQNASSNLTVKRAEKAVLPVSPGSVLRPVFYCKNNGPYCGDIFHSIATKRDHEKLYHVATYANHAHECRKCLRRFWEVKTRDAHELTCVDSPPKGFADGWSHGSLRMTNAPWRRTSTTSGRKRPSLADLAGIAHSPAAKKAASPAASTAAVEESLNDTISDSNSPSTSSNRSLDEVDERVEIVENNEIVDDDEDDRPLDLLSRVAQPAAKKSPSVSQETESPEIEEIVTDEIEEIQTFKEEVTEVVGGVIVQEAMSANQTPPTHQRIPMRQLPISLSTGRYHQVDCTCRACTYCEICKDTFATHKGLLIHTTKLHNIDLDGPVPNPSYPSSSASSRTVRTNSSSATASNRRPLAPALKSKVTSQRYPAAPGGAKLKLSSLYHEGSCKCRECTYCTLCDYEFSSRHGHQIHISKIHPDKVDQVT